MGWVFGVGRKYVWYSKGNDPLSTNSTYVYNIFGSIFVCYIKNIWTRLMFKLCKTVETNKQ